MAYLIGTDEAGYGPNLGPLLIAGTVWHVEDDGQDLDLYRRLQGCIDRMPSTSPDRERVVIADSKILYQPAKGVRLLERALLSCLSLLDKQFAGWQPLWDELAPHSKSTRDALPWYHDFHCDLPLVCESDEISSLAASLRRTFQASHVRLVAIASTAVFPGPFNDLVESYGNKSTLLSLTTLSLVKRLMRDLKLDTSPERIFVLCDKHGGRSRYGAMLQQTFPEYLVEVRAERPAESIYCWGPTSRRVEMRFQACGESFLPTALASITAKYLREAAMRAFNTFWCDQVPDLHPTAGYPVDARRFRAKIESARQRLAINEYDLWRTR